VLNEISIKGRLLVGVISVLLFIWLIVIVLVYQSSAHEIDEIYDASLASYARVLASLMAHEAAEEQEINEKIQQAVKELGSDYLQHSSALSDLLTIYRSPYKSEDYITLELAERQRSHPYESKIAFLVKASDGKVLLRSSPDVSFENVDTGYHNINNNGNDWRVFGLWVPRLAMSVIVGENVKVRTELQDEILMNVLFPFLVSLPIIALLIMGAINKGLKPLKAITERVSKRSPTSLAPFQINNVPSEVLPLVDELNHLFQRIDQALDNERRFTANAAHELRTPLASLKTNIQVLQLSATEEQQDSIDKVLRGIDRATHLVEQLLALARAEAESHEDIKPQSVNLESLVETIMIDTGHHALEKDIEISFEKHTDKYDVQTDEGLLQMIIQNILDNAIRYTPVGGSVNVKLREASGIIELLVEDSGPGIPDELQEVMFQRFQRGTQNGVRGVGLGLSIVKQIAQLLDIEIVMTNATTKGGLIVRLIFS